MQVSIFISRDDAEHDQIERMLGLMPIDAEWSPSGNEYLHHHRVQCSLADVQGVLEAMREAAINEARIEMEGI